MEMRFFSTLGAALGVVILGASVSFAGLWVPGDYQIANGGAGNWDPATAPTMTDLTGGFWELELTGLGASTRYQFKILDDQGDPPPAFSDDPEVPDNGPGSQNSWFLTDINGDATISPRAVVKSRAVCRSTSPMKRSVR